MHQTNLLLFFNLCICLSLFVYLFFNIVFLFFFFFLFMFVPFLLLLLFLFLSSFVFFMFSFLFPLLPWTLSAVKLLFCANAAVSGRSPQRSCFCKNAAVSGRSTQKSCARICRIYNLSCIYLLLFSFWILQFQSYSAINDDPLHKYIDILYIAVFLVAHDMCVYSRHRSAHTTALL